MYQCFHCLHNTLCWDCDYDYSDFGFDGDGIVQILHCENCGAEVEYRVKIEKNNKKKEKKNNGNKND